ncbi:DDE-type integrase/transposase/recombinase [Reyranella aquatilis]|uniref:DDE-type integrase/transposase/recombinase n=1 Tax=Reyranella aquatilis TaxID=2035356 RepID=A0ABS8L001_9HYPH|nr:DDE-type integrase/transposase/recombinase [Reyranella aquatilis]MCC8431684.1 DDE-type integrase/transposase/recombinase [Reyranella aquatilis]
MDFTYIPTAHGSVYLVGVLDWLSPRALSRRLSINMEKEFCVEALEDASAHRSKPELFNTDQGSPLTGAAISGVLVKTGMAISMDGKGRWRENVFDERLWRSLTNPANCTTNSISRVIGAA